MEAPDNINISYIGRWADDVMGGLQTKIAISAGSKLRFKFTGTSLSLAIRPTSEAEQPRISYAIDGAGFTTASVLGTTVLAGGLADTLHTVEIYCEGVYYSTGSNSWNSHEGLMIQGINIDSGKVLSPWATSLPRMLSFGDSITEGLNAQAGGAESVASSCGRQSWSNVLAALVGAENHVVACGGQGILLGGRRGFPDALNAYPYKMAGINKADPTVRIVNILFGHNDSFASNPQDFSAQYSAYIDMIRADQPTAHFFLIGTLSLGTAFRTNIQTIAESSPYNNFCSYIDPSAWSISYTEGVHPTIAGHAAIAGYLQSVVAAQLAILAPAESTGALRLKTTLGLVVTRMTPGGPLRLHLVDQTLELGFGGAGPVRMMTSQGVQVISDGAVGIDNTLLFSDLSPVLYSDGSEVTYA